jgi:uncharacterized protein YjiS (DUF1127 family)
MELIMSRISNRAMRDPVANPFLGGPGRALRRWWIAYINWRLQHSAIARLKSLSDRELNDVGLSRVQIQFAVMGEAARDVMSSRVP